MGESLPWAALRKGVVHRPGGVERLAVEQHPDPVPGSGEVLIDVAAAGVNFADVAVRLGLYASAKQYVGWPITPGFEVSGRVAALGAGVSAPRMGAEVMAVTRFGGYVSHLVVPADQTGPLPPGFGLRQAGGFPVVFLTAWYALRRMLHAEAGETVLVHSAAGGVGCALLQLARAFGVRSVGVVSSAAKVEAARAAGADVVIDTSRADLWEAARGAAPGGFDGVLDANGGPSLRNSYRHLAPGGRLVAYGFHTLFKRGSDRIDRLRLAAGWLRMPRFDPLKMTNENKSVLAFNLSYLFDRRDILSRALAELDELARAGRIRPPPTTEVPLAEVAEAHRRLQSGATVGKLVLVP